MFFDIRQKVFIQAWQKNIDEINFYQLYSSTYKTNPI